MRRSSNKPVMVSAHWQTLLDGGFYASLSEIGESENISKSYVSRILRLALLAPDIIEAIRPGSPVER
jgi:DNA-binding IscR family transcriptional regulator